jgi:secreted protein with Ig-like and vWFA domain
MNEDFDSNDIGNNSSNNRMDTELQVRLMNLVMGEASDFERDQLQTLMEERADVAAYYQHLEHLHGLLCEVGTGELSLDAAASEKHSTWRLSTDRRDKLLAILDGEVQNPSPTVELASSSDTKPKPLWSRAWMAGLATAAASLLVALLMLPRSQYARKTNISLEPESMTPYRIVDEKEPASSLPYPRYLDDNVHYFGRELDASSQANLGKERFIRPDNSLAVPVTPLPPATSAPPASLDALADTPSNAPSSSVSKRLSENAPNVGLGLTEFFFDKRVLDPVTLSGKIDKDPQVAIASGGMGGSWDASQALENFSKPGLSTPSDLGARVDTPKLQTDDWEVAGSAVERQPENALAELVLQQSEERDKQQSQTEVNVPDGGTVMLGGIKRQSADEINQSLPYLNRLYKNNAIGRDTNPPMMTVTPRIIIPEEEEETLSRFSSEPPVRYPDQKTWEQLANRRKNQFGNQTTQQDSASRFYRNDRLGDGDKVGLSNAMDKRPTPSAEWNRRESNGWLRQPLRESVELKDRAEMRGRFRNVVPPPSPKIAAEKSSVVDGIKENEERQAGAKSEDFLAVAPAPAKRELAEAKKELPQIEKQSSIDETSASKDPFSTFSLHVSDVSFQLAQAALGQGQWPEAAKIRIEEFVNALDYRDPLPNGNERVACRAEQAIHPFLMQRNLLRVSMRTAATGRAQNTPLRLTILLDNSGSMERPDRRQAVLQGFQSLSSQLNAADQVTLISFASTPRLLADKVPGNQGESLLQQIENLPSEGGTNIEAALLLAREKAMEQNLSGAQNRIVLLTDGAVNLGNANPESLATLVTQLRDSGIAFDAAGISAQDLNDEVLEALTRQGDGRYYLLDSAESANESFASQIAGSLRPSAQNVKVQIEFNPQRVGQYKLLGFEKHRLNQEDFRNDKVDAAEMAAAEAGVAVYQFEIKPNGTGDVGNVSVRFRDLSTGQMVENRWPIPYESNTPRLEQSEPSMQLAACSALFAAKLAGGPLADSVDLVSLQKILANLPEQTSNQPRVQQLRTMVDQAVTIGR